MNNDKNMINGNQSNNSQGFNEQLKDFQCSVLPNTIINKNVVEMNNNSVSLNSLVNSTNMNTNTGIDVDSVVSSDNSSNIFSNENQVFLDNNQNVFVNDNQILLGNNDNSSEIGINFFEEPNLESVVEQVLIDAGGVSLDKVNDKEINNKLYNINNDLVGQEKNTINDSNLINQGLENVVTVNDTSNKSLMNVNKVDNTDFNNKSFDNNLNEEIIPREIVVNRINGDFWDDEDLIEMINDEKVGTKNREDVVYDDWIDTEDIDNEFSIKRLLGSKKFLMVLSVLIFIFVSIVVIKAFYLGDKVDSYEEFFTVIESKDEDSVIISNDNRDNDVLGNDAASELINCINSSIDSNNLPDSISSIINEINNYYNQSNNYFSFVYKDLVTGFMVSYNANQSIFAASSIKAPKDIYLWEMASRGLINLDEELTYASGYYNTGSGVLKNKKINTKYSVRTLLEYSTVTSDNAAHNMLMDKYGRENMYNFWKEKGTKSIFTANNNWGVTSGHDAAIYMEELYKFYVSDSEYGEAAMNNFINSYPKFLKGKNEYRVASKSGWSGSALHDVSIIFADNPYIVVALSNLGDTDYYMSYFNTVNDLAYKLHTEYWKYKMSVCSSISQYE